MVDEKLQEALFLAKDLGDLATPFDLNLFNIPATLYSESISLPRGRSKIGKKREKANA